MQNMYNMHNMHKPDTSSSAFAWTNLVQGYMCIKISNALSMVVVFPPNLPQEADALVEV